MPREVVSQRMGNWAGRLIGKVSMPKPRSREGPDPAKIGDRHEAFREFGNERQ